MLFRALFFAKFFRSRPLLALIVVAAFTAFTAFNYWQQDGVAPIAPSMRQEVARTAPAGITAEKIWTATRQMSAAENAAAHWRKHRTEFPELSDQDDYVRTAVKFVTAPPNGTEQKIQADGDTAFYHAPTNTFAVQRKDGRIRTMFRPESGRAYFDRQ